MLKNPFAKRISVLPMLVSTLSLGGFGNQVSAHDVADHNLLDPVCKDPTDTHVEGRRRPGDKMPEPAGSRACNPNAVVPASQDQVTEFVDMPSRWRIVEAVGVPNNYIDPYSGNNPLKGDRPVWGTKDWFFNLNASSTTLFEPRRVPLVRSTDGTSAGGKAEHGEQNFFRQDFSVDVTVYKGDTIFRPPDWAFRFNPVATLRETSGEGKSFTDNDWAVQNMYVEKHLWDVSDNYDYDSVRFGIQNFNADWRGFLFLDQPMGLRMFGTRHNNVFQYNLGWFRPWTKHETTGLNKVEDRLRDHDIFLGNLYWQDMFVQGLHGQFLVAYSRNRERGVRFTTDATGATFHTDKSHDYDVVYLGYNTDGHIGRLNLSGSMYGALGSEKQSQFTGHHSDVGAFFAALEASMDFDWIRVRASGMHASGDDDPYDDDSEGFDSIRDNPMFAGADTSFYMRQRLIMPGGAINLSRRNSFMNGFRPADDSNQASYTNPGFNLLGVGMDFDIRPEWRVSFNANQMWFDETDVLEVLTGEDSIGHNIGQDFSVATIYRPFNNQNVVLRASGAMLIPGQGYRDLYDSQINYSFQTSVLLQY